MTILVQSTCKFYDGVARADGKICCDPRCEKCGGSGCGSGGMSDLCCGVGQKIFDVCGINATKAPCLLQGIILYQLKSDTDDSIEADLT